MQYNRLYVLSKHLTNSNYYPRKRLWTCNNIMHEESALLKKRRKYFSPHATNLSPENTLRIQIDKGWKKYGYFSAHRWRSARSWLSFFVTQILCLFAQMDFYNGRTMKWQQGSNVSKETEKTASRTAIFAHVDRGRSSAAICSPVSALIATKGGRGRTPSPGSY